MCNLNIIFLRIVFLLIFPLNVFLHAYNTFKEILVLKVAIVM